MSWGFFSAWRIVNATCEDSQLAVRTKFAMLKQQRHPAQHMARAFANLDLALVRLEAVIENCTSMQLPPKTLETSLASMALV